MHQSAAAELDAVTRSFVALAFIDLCGSTRLANRLDPDHFAALLGEIRDAAAAIVRDHGGLVSQVYGDGMLAVFRGPVGGEQARAAALAVHRQGRGMPEVATERLRMHSGVHSGLVLLRPGDAERGRLETIGRATGIAARLCAAAGPDEVLVSRSTLGPLDGRFAHYRCSATRLPRCRTGRLPGGARRSSAARLWSPRSRRGC
jgi:class 3 adenylate cyclase